METELLEEGVREGESDPGEKESVRGFVDGRSCCPATTENLVDDC